MEPKIFYIFYLVRYFRSLRSTIYALLPTSRCSQAPTEDGLDLQPTVYRYEIVIRIAKLKLSGTTIPQA